MAEYSKQGAARPRYVPADEPGNRVSRPGARPVPRGPVPPPVPPPRPPRAARPEPWGGAPEGRPRRPEPSRRRERRGPAGSPGPGKRRAGGGPAGLRLTGRGAVLCLFVLSFLGMLISGWLGTGVLADVLFVIGCGGIACYAKPSDLLPVAVSPPLAFFFACVLAKLASSSGGTSAAEGTLVSLANSAPWLFAGTALTLVIGLRRGLLGNIRELRQGLQGNPAGEVPRADGKARRR